MLAVAVMASSMLVSYERAARRVARSQRSRGGLMERAERFVFLAFALAFNILGAGDVIYAGAHPRARPSTGSRSYTVRPRTRRACTRAGPFA